MPVRHRIETTGINCALHKAENVPRACPERKSNDHAQRVNIAVAELRRRTTLSRFFMIEPPLYKTIAVASTFSPRFVQVLSEAKRIRDRFGSELSAIYVGECSDETVKKFREIFGQLKLPDDSRVFYQQGEDPAGGILQALTDNEIDMIVAG